MGAGIKISIAPINRINRYLDSSINAALENICTKETRVCVNKYNRNKHKKDKVKKVMSDYDNVRIKKLVLKGEKHK